MTTLELLKKNAEALRCSKFNKGEPILFCVDYGLHYSHNIHSALFSTAENAIAFAKTFSADDYVHAYPCFDIWQNPKQVDLFVPTGKERV